MAYQNKKYKKKNQQTDILQIIVIGVFKILWWLIKLPFGKTKKQKISGQDISYIRSKRQEIEGLMNSNSEIELKHAVMEADKLVDYVLKTHSYPGDTFADRLRSAEKYLDNDVYQSLWEGHKTRNRIAHEHELRITNQELCKAVKDLLVYANKI